MFASDTGGSLFALGIVVALFLTNSEVSSSVFLAKQYTIIYNSFSIQFIDRNNQPRVQLGCFHQAYSFKRKTKEINYMVFMSCLGSLINFNEDS